MKNTLKVQMGGVNTLKEEILSHSNSKLKKIYIIASDIKETGYDIIEECLIDLKARKFIVIGIDKKNTTKKMLEDVLKYTKNVYIWDNNSEVEISSNMLVFEYEDTAYVYTLSSSITDSLLETDLAIYNVITYDLIEDKKEYEEYINTIVKLAKDEFTKLTKELIDELIENKKIFSSKQFLHTIPSISELLGKTEEEKEKPTEKVEIPKIKIEKDIKDEFEIDLGDIDIATDEDIEEKPKKESKQKTIENDIEEEAFGLDEEVHDINEEPFEVSDEAIDLEAFALEDSVVKIDKKTISKKEKKESKEEKIEKNKKINLDKVSNIIMELASKPTKGKDIDKIKIPNYIKDMVPNFFEIMEDAKLENIDGVDYKRIKINLEIIDVNTSQRFVDNDAYISQKQGQTYTEFISEKIIDIKYEEMDIARIIKLAKDSYHIEIIPNGIEEYNLWKKLCTNSFRGSSRQYGLM